MGQACTWQEVMGSKRAQTFPQNCQEAFNKGFLCAVLDLSGTLWPLLIPEYSGIKELREEALLSPFPGLRNPGISHYSDKCPLPFYEPHGKR